MFARLPKSLIAGFLTVIALAAGPAAAMQPLPDYSGKSALTLDSERLTCLENVEEILAFNRAAQSAVTKKSVRLGGYVSSADTQVILSRLSDVNTKTLKTYRLLRGPGRSRHCRTLKVFFKGRVDNIMQAVFKGSAYTESYAAAPYLTDPNLPAMGWLGLRLAKSHLSATSTSEDKGLLVTEVVRGGPSEGRIHVGDVVLAIDNWATDNEPDAAAASAATRQAGVVSALLIVRRKTGAYQGVRISLPL
jgi:hypothetical protein